MVVLIALTSPSCADSRECEPAPSSARLAVGESADVEIELIGGGFGSLDAGRVYWTTDEAVPAGLPAHGRAQGIATLVSGDGDTSDQMTSGTVSVAFSPGDIVGFEGTISCN